MRSLVFGKRWRKAGEETSGKNETDCSGKRRILRKRVKRISEDGEADCLWGRKNLRMRVKRIPEKSEAYCPEKRKILRKRERRISEDEEACCLWGRKNLRKHERRISEDKEADWLEKRNGVTWKRFHSGSENAARCMCWRSTLHRPTQRAASAIAPHCVFRLTLLLLVPRRHRLLRQAPLSYPARAPDTIGRGCKEEAPSCSFPVRKVQEGALLYPVTLHSSAHLSLRKGAAWSGHSV